MCKCYCKCWRNCWARFKKCLGLESSTIDMQDEISSDLEDTFFKIDSNSPKRSKKVFPLPNLDVTSYLNTNIQLVHSMQLLRKYLLIYGNERIYQRNIYCSLFGRLFQAMEQRDEILKRNIIKQMLYRLKKDHQSIESGKYQDIKETYYFLLNKICQEDDKIARMVLLSYQFFSSDQYILSGKIRDQLFWKIEETFNGSKIDKKILNKPKYVTVIPKQTKIQQYLYLEHPQCQLKYRLVSFANYSGTGSSGHYTACRKDERYWIQVSDSNMRKSVLSKMRQEHPILVYELFESSKSDYKNIYFRFLIY